MSESIGISNTARGSVNSINLRGLGSGYSLILLNGRRLATHPIPSTEEARLPSDSVNITQLPAAGLERVEVLLDGTSSIYGTDAIASVVNYITDKNLIGTEVSLLYGQTRYGDGQDFKASIKHGGEFFDGRGRLLTVLDYYHREPIYNADRSYTSRNNNEAHLAAKAPWNSLTNPVINVNNNPFFQFASLGVANQIPGDYPSFLIGSTRHYIVPPEDDNPHGAASLTTVAPRLGGASENFYWNQAQFYTPQSGSDRFTATVSGEFDLTGTTTLFTDLHYFKALSEGLRPGIPYRADGGIDGTNNPVIVPVVSTWNPFDQPIALRTGASRCRASYLQGHRRCIPPPRGKWRRRLSSVEVRS